MKKSISKSLVTTLIIVSFLTGCYLLTKESKSFSVSKSKDYPDSVKPFNAIYTAEDNAIVSYNGTRFFNRPLYAPNIQAITLAGDKPQMRLIDSEYHYGALLLGYVRGESSKWLHEFDNITTRFYPARVVWEISDFSMDGVFIHCEGLAQANGNGMTLKITIKGQLEGDKIIWAFGGGTPKTPDRTDVPTVIWAYDPTFNPGQTEKGLTLELCSFGNLAKVSGEAFVLTPSLSGGHPSNEHYSDVLGDTQIGPPRKQSAYGNCSAPSNPIVGDASALGSPLALIRSVGGKSPIVCGQFSASQANQAVYLGIQSGASSQAESFLGTAKGMPDLASIHEKAVGRAHDFANRVVIDTPDPALDAAVSFQAAAVDATWYPPYYTHGGMIYNSRFLGWRRLYAPTAFGWHENVRTEMKYYLTSQVLESTNTKPKADPNFKLTLQAPDSRMFVVLESVELETLSQEVVIGLMGVTVMN